MKWWFIKSWGLWVLEYKVSGCSELSSCFWWVICCLTSTFMGSFCSCFSCSSVCFCCFSVRWRGCSAEVWSIGAPKLLTVHWLSRCPPSFPSSPVQPHPRLWCIATVNLQIVKQFLQPFVMRYGELCLLTFWASLFVDLFNACFAEDMTTICLHRFAECYLTDRTFSLKMCWERGDKFTVIATHAESIVHGNR